MNKTDSRSFIPHLDPNVKNFFKKYLEKCKAQNKHDVNHFSEKIITSLKAKSEAYFQLYVKPFSDKTFMES